MSSGISYLKKNKVDVINGFGKVKSGNKIVVTTDGKSKDYSAKHIIIATGVEVENSNLPQDGKVIGYRDALVLPKVQQMVVAGSGVLIEFAYFLMLWVLM